MKKSSFLLILLSSFFLFSCAILSDYKDTTLDTQYNDAQIRTDILSTLLQRDASLAEHVEIYSFAGHVFLIGLASEEFKVFALNAARAVKGVVSVTPHWFTDTSESRVRDASLAAEVEGKLLFDKTVSSSDMTVVSWGGNILLLGTMADEESIIKAITTARGQSSVKSVTSYLFTK